MRRPSPATALSFVALLVALSGTAYAATGGTFVLGRANTASSTTSLSNARGTALSLSAPAGRPALQVSNTVEVPHLNANLLQGKASSAFLGATGTAANASKLGGSPASAFGAVETARVTGVPAVASSCAGPGNCFVATYGGVSGIGAAVVSQVNADTLSPGLAMVLRDLSVQVSTAPGANDALQVGVSVNDSGGAILTCLVLVSATTCHDTSHAVAVTAGSRLSIVVVDNQAEGAGPIPAESVLVGFRMTST